MVVNIGVLASGGGSNFQSVLDSIASGFITGAKITVLVSDNPGAHALTRAKDNGIPAFSVERKDYDSRAKHDNAMIEILNLHKVELVLLAGYMRLVSPEFVRAFPDRIMNIHPALLPCFPGTHAQKDALEYGVKVSGCTVHFVDEKMDHGPIVIQKSVPVFGGDTVESLAMRIIAEEHKVYPQAVKWYVEGRLSVEGRIVHVDE